MPPTTPDSTTSLEDDQLATVPGFGPMPPPASPGPDPRALEGMTPPPTTNAGGDPGGWADPDVEVGPPGTSPTSTESSPASTERGGRKRNKRKRAGGPRPSKELRELTHTLVGLASVVVRFVRAQRRPLTEDAWIADEQDMAAIGDPLARIAARHAPIDGGEGNADVVDGINAMVGATHYVVKNMPREGEAVPVDEQGQPLEGEPQPDAGAPGWPGQ